MDAATVGVLRDVAILVWVALIIGAGAYNVLRTARPALAWNRSGRVDASHFAIADAGVVAAISVVMLSALQPNHVPEVQSPQLSVMGLLANITILLSVCVALLFYLRFFRGLNPADIFGLRQQGPVRAILIACIFIVPTLLVVNIFAANLMEWLKAFWPNAGAQDTVEAFRKSDSFAAKSLMVIAAVVVAPLVEETVFRGLIYGVIKCYTDGYFAAVCSALLFATVHFHVGSLFPLAILALAFCAAYEITGSLLVPMAMHALFNATSLALLAFTSEHT